MYAHSILYVRLVDRLCKFSQDDTGGTFYKNVNYLRNILATVIVTYVIKY